MVHILIIRLKSFWRAVVQDHLWKRDIGSLWKNDGIYVFVWILYATQVASRLQLQNKMFWKLIILRSFIRRTWTWVRKRRLLWETKNSTKRKKWSSSIFVLPPKLWVFFFFSQFYHLCLVADLANTKYYTGWYFVNILVGAKMYKRHAMQYQRHTCSGVT